MEKGSAMTRDELTKGQLDAFTELSNQVYDVACKFLEGSEYAGTIRGNGHHMAQELARLAEELYLDRALPDPPGCGAPNRGPDAYRAPVICQNGRPCSKHGERHAPRQVTAETTPLVVRVETSNDRT